MQAVSRDRVLAATLDFDESTISFCELQRIGKSVIDDDELIPMEDYDSPACDCVIQVLAAGEIVTNELKGELEEELRMRFAHHNMCEPHIPLREKQHD